MSLDIEQVRGEAFGVVVLDEGEDVRDVVLVFARRDRDVVDADRIPDGEEEEVEVRAARRVEPLAPPGAVQREVTQSKRQARREGGEVEQEFSRARHARGGPARRPHVRRRQGRHDRPGEGAHLCGLGHVRRRHLGHPVGGQGPWRLRPSGSGEHEPGRSQVAGRRRRGRVRDQVRPPRPTRSPSGRSTAPTFARATPTTASASTSSPPGPTSPRLGRRRTPRSTRSAGPRWPRRPSPASPR